MKKVHSRSCSRAGVILSMELVLILPVFLLLFFSVVEFSMLMSAQTRVSNAAHSGARLMSISGAAPVDVREKVVALLGSPLSNGCEIDVIPAEFVGDLGIVRVRVPMSNASPDLLWITGFSLKGRSINSEVPMVMERTTSDGLSASL